MFKTVLFSILWFPLAIVDAIVSLISVLIVILGKFLFGWIEGEDEYNGLLKSKIKGWTMLKNGLKFD